MKSRMKKKPIILFLSLTLVAVSYVFAQHFWRGELMSLKKVEKKWGQSEFSAERFKTAPPSEKAKMAYSLIKSKKYIAKSVIDIRQDLGDPDGYYFSDIYPAYIITDSQKKGDDVWQIVFLLDKNRTISEVVVHKNCCYSK